MVGKEAKQGKGASLRWEQTGGKMSDCGLEGKLQRILEREPREGAEWE